jgi:MoaA/NifB/PqqE/SkfB family radical SAM enzyme
MKISLQQLKDIRQDRNIYIWGAMIVGQGVCRSLQRHDIPVTSFLDSSEELQKSTALGYSIQSPSLLEQAGTENRLIIVSSGHYDREIAAICREKGLIPNVDYILSRDLNDIDPSVDVAGSCNLKCKSCPRGNMEDPTPKGLMKVDDYRLVLDKLLTEIPFLGSIQLYAWGEPFLHKRLPEIIAMNRDAKVLTAISTNLNVKVDFDRFLVEKPDWIKVSASGFGPNYEITHTGGKWDVFHDNLYKLAESRDRVHPELQVVLNYHLYKHNCDEDYRNMKALCNELGFVFRSNHAYVYPMDIVMDDIEGRPIPQEAKDTKELLLMPVEEGVKKAQALKHLPCPEERCLPITWDRKVRFCGVYFNPFLASDFLDETVEGLMETRKQSEFCEHCKSHGLHQYTGVYLQETLLKTE